MKNILKIVALLFFASAAIIYGYAYMNDHLEVSYVSKSMVIPMLLLYYLASAEKKNKLFMIGFFFAFCGNLVLFYTSELSFILAMACSLFYLLIHIILISNLIGEIKIALFLKIALVFSAVISMVLYLVFNDTHQIETLFYVFGIILGIYLTFAYYLYHKIESMATGFNLLGIFLFLLFSIFKGVEVTRNEKGWYTVIALILYPLYFFLITATFTIIDTPKKRQLKV